MSPPLGEGSEVAGKYRVIRHLGTGGMGQVYAALDLSRNEAVALKVLPGDKRRDALARSRLVLEGRAAAGVRHPGIVRIHEVGEAGEIAYVAMELLEGEDLHERMHRRGPLPVDEVMAIARALLEAMRAMHEADIIHRDLKPRNLFLAREPGGRETLKVLDFGIAKRLAPTDHALTDSGQVFGTLHYMAPEQLRGVKHADVRSEIWAAGAILYEALAGKPPFEGESGPELVLKIAIETPVPLRQHRPDVPDGLRRAIARAMQREPAARYASASDMLAALDATEADAPDFGADTRPVSSDLLEQLDALQAADQAERSAPARITPTPLTQRSVDSTAPGSVFCPGPAPSCSPGLGPAPRADTDPSQNPRRHPRSNQLTSALAPSVAAVAAPTGGRLVSWLLAAAIGALLVAGMTQGSSAIGVAPARQVANARAPEESRDGAPVATTGSEAPAPPSAAPVVVRPREAGHHAGRGGLFEAGPSVCEAACEQHAGASAEVAPSRSRRRGGRASARPGAAPTAEPARAVAAPHPVPSSAGELRRDQF